MENETKSIIRKIAIENNACDDAIKWLDANKEHSDKWLWENCTRPGWMVWFLRHSIDLTKETWAQIAVACAESVIDVYENNYPDDSLPRKAIKAAKAWLANPTSDAAKASDAAAVLAVHAASYDAHDAYAAHVAYAAYAASYAGYVPADDAAYAAADAAAYAATYGSAYVAYGSAYADAAFFSTRGTNNAILADQIRELVPWAVVVRLEK